LNPISFSESDDFLALKIHLVIPHSVYECP
jgi:hypothetical protein